MTTTQFPKQRLALIVRVSVAEKPHGLLVARSPDLPGRVAVALNMTSLSTQIRDAIERHFADRGQQVQIRKSSGYNDVSTWEVEVVDNSEERISA